jgi:S-adenosylmethionine uptake transporter
MMAIARPGWPSRESIRINGVRSLLAVAMSLCFFYALKTLPLGDAIALSFLSPTFLALFGGWFLGERVTRWIWLALGVGFLGMLAIVSGQLGSGTYGEGALLGAAGAFAAAVFYALSAVLLRSRAKHDPVITIVFIQNLGPALILAVPGWLVWTTPSAWDMGLFALIGIIGTGGHLMISHAFARAEANRLAPFEYTALVWAGVFGFAFFSEVPGLLALAGVALIVVSAVIAGRR